MVFKVAWQRVHVMGWKNAKSAALSLCSIELHWSLSPPKRRISQRAAQFAQNRAAPAIRANFDNGSVDAGQSCSLSFFAFFHVITAHISRNCGKITGKFDKY